MRPQQRASSPSDSDSAPLSPIAASVQHEACSSACTLDTSAMEAALEDASRSVVAEREADLQQARAREQAARATLQDLSAQQQSHLSAFCKQLEQQRREGIAELERRHKAEVDEFCRGLHARAEEERSACEARIAARVRELAVALAGGSVRGPVAWPGAGSLRGASPQPSYMTPHKASVPQVFKTAHDPAEALTPAQRALLTERPPSQVRAASRMQAPASAASSAADAATNQILAHRPTGSTAAVPTSGVSGLAGRSPFQRMRNGEAYVPPRREYTGGACRAKYPNADGLFVNAQRPIRMLDLLDSDDDNGVDEP